MTWTAEEEAVLREIRDKSEALYKHHLKDYTYYNRLSIKYNVPILVISALNSLMAIALTEFIEQKYVSIINAVLSAGTGVLGSVQLFLKVNEKLAKSTSSAILYEKLFLKIRKELTLDLENRDQDSKTFVNDCFKDFTSYIEKSNPIERHQRVKIDKELTNSSSDFSVAEKLLYLSRTRVDGNSPSSSPRSDDEPYIASNQEHLQSESQRT